MTKGNSTTVASVRLQDSLYKRAVFLATKRKMSLNDWIKMLIKNAAQWKDE